MEFLWGKDLRINCVHINDVVNTIWLACKEFPIQSIYNLTDLSDLTQGKFNEILKDLFDIKTGFMVLLLVI